MDYQKLVSNLLDYGQFVPSRMGDTREAVYGHVITRSGEVPKRLGFNKKLGYMELTQLLAGVYYPELIAEVAPNANHGLFTPQMAYGPRIADQMPRLVEVLRQEPGTRQAVLFVGKPEDGPTSNLPCTLTIQFLRRHGVLRCVVTMRSWDVIKGLPYDLTMFGGLHLVMAGILGDVAGELAVNAGSMHVYLEDAEKRPTNQFLRFDLRHDFRQWGDVVETAHTSLNPGTWDNGTPGYLREARDETS